MINGQDFIGKEQKGRVVTILGDTKKTAKSIQLAKNADVLVHESTFSGEEGKMAKEYNHSTNIEAAETAKEAGVKNLLLTHISARYLGPDVKKLEKDARQIFPRTCVMKDFQEFDIPLHKEK